MYASVYRVKSRLKGFLIRRLSFLYKTQVQSLDLCLQNQGGQLKEQESQLKEQESQLKEQESQLKEQESQLKEQESQLKEQESQLKKQDNRLNEQNIFLKDMNLQLSNFISAVQRMELTSQFKGHYELWRDLRVAAILEHYSPLWFDGKKILELGAGYGDIGAVFKTLGCSVTCAEAREENLLEIKKRHPAISAVLCDSESEWPFSGSFDLILHLGLLYHLDDFEFSLRKSLESARYIVLETEVCDSSSPDFVLKVEESSLGYDQSFRGIGSRPSESYIERILDEYNAQYEKLTTNKCNSSFHNYNWQVQNTKRWCHGLRRLWFIRMNSHDQD